MSEAYYEYTRERRLQDAVEEAQRQLAAIIEHNPDLYQYVQYNHISQAVRTLQHLEKLLPQYFELLKALVEATRKADPRDVVMAILPEGPLVITKTQTGFRALAPVLSCTLNAIGDLERGPLAGQAGIVRSTNGLIPLVIKTAMREDCPVINYDRALMRAEDYVAFAASEGFFNEALVVEF